MSDDSLDRKLDRKSDSRRYLKAGICGVTGMIIGSAGYTVHTAMELSGKSEAIDFVLTINGCVYYTTGLACMAGAAYLVYQGLREPKR